MKKVISKTGLLICILLISTVSFAQSYQLAGRSAVGLNLGYLAGSQSGNNVVVNGLNVGVSSSNGFAGGIFFSHWLQENLSLKLNTGLLTASSDVSVNLLNVSTQSSAVYPVLLGLNYYLLNLTESNNVRPFVSLSAGMFLGNEAKNTTLSTQAHTETAIGGRVGIGTDFLISSHFILGANLGYNLMSDFTNPIGGRNNFNGADFSFQTVYVF